MHQLILDIGKSKLHVSISRITIKEIARAYNAQVNKGSVLINTLVDTIIRKNNEEQ